MNQDRIEDLQNQIQFLTNQLNELKQKLSVITGDEQLNLLGQLLLTILLL